MRRPLKVLLVEDNAVDAELIARQLRKDGFEPACTRVWTEEAFVAGLRDDPDIVLSDFDLPHFNGLHALKVLQEGGWQVPFILISGTIGEDTAVEAMRFGALDYLLKDRLSRLGPAIERALVQGRLRREKDRAMESLRLFRTLVDQSSDAFEVIDLATGRFVDVNEYECAELGYAREELIGLAVREVDPAVTPENWRAFAERVRAEGQVTGEGIHRRRDGTLFPIEFRARLVRLDREFIVSVVRNITERKAAMEALRASEERFRQMAENIDEVFWMTDTDHQRTLYVSPGFERIWGRSCGELYARPRLWGEAIVPEDRARILLAIRTKELRGEFDEEYRIQRPDGTVRWVRDRAFPIRNEAGEIYRVAGVARDITDRKQLEEQFLRAQRLEAVGTLAGGVAHDLNNILAPVMMITGLLKSRLTDAEDLKTLGLLEGAAKRGAAIVRQLLTFSRGAGGDRVVIQLRHLAREMIVLMRETFPRDIRISERCADGLWPVLGDPTQLHQVLMNLCVNARDAMPEGGELTIAAENAELGPEATRPHRRARPGRHVVLSVTDTGHGIPADLLERIFDPFFTTREPGRGTGLGLSTALGIVEGHGGFVTVRSEPGRGSTFCVCLPAADATPEAPAPDAAPAPGSGRGETVLVVDDEASIRETTRALLERNNYRVLLAEDGQEAIECFVANQDSVRLVITDVMMPRMGGLALVRALRTIQPALPVLVATGFGVERRTAELAALGVAGVLQKPFGGPELLHGVHRALGR